MALYDDEQNLKRQVEIKIDLWCKNCGSIITGIINEFDIKQNVKCRQCNTGYFITVSRVDEN